MARRATIIATLPDAWGDLWDVRESTPTQYGLTVLRGWPAGFPRGRGGCGSPRVILTAELVELLEQHRMKSGGLRLPFSRAVLKRFRRMLGHHRGADVSQWWHDRADDLAALSLVEFARKHQCQVSSASVWHSRLFGRKNRPAQWWHCEEVASLLLSEMPTAYKAEKLECSIGAIHRLVWATRQRLGIQLSESDRAAIIEQVAASKRGKPAHPNTIAALHKAATLPKSTAHRAHLAMANSQNRKRIVARLHGEGVSQAEIARHLGTSRQRIHQIIEEIAMSRTAIDYTGIKWGNWKVLRRDGTVNRLASWRCKCECGHEQLVGSSRIRLREGVTCEKCGKQPESRRALCSDEEFVRAWQSSQSVEEVASKLGGGTPGVLRSLAFRMRKHGVPLKKFPRKGYDRNTAEKYNKLKELATALLKAEEENNAIP